MHDYNTILGVIELRLSKVSYDTVQKRYRIGRSGIILIMKRYNESGLSLDVSSCLRCVSFSADLFGKKNWSTDIS